MRPTVEQEADYRALFALPSSTSRLQAAGDRTAADVQRRARTPYERARVRIALARLREQTGRDYLRLVRLLLQGNVRGAERIVEEWTADPESLHAIFELLGPALLPTLVQESTPRDRALPTSGPRVVRAVGCPTPRPAARHDAPRGDVLLRALAHAATGRGGAVRPREEPPAI